MQKSNERPILGPDGEFRKDIMYKGVCNMPGGSCFLISLICAFCMGGPGIMGGEVGVGFFGRGSPWESIRNQRAFSFGHPEASRFLWFHFGGCNKGRVGS